MSFSFGFKPLTSSLLRTDANEAGTGHHPRNIIEIAAGVRLRDAYRLKDGDWIEIDCGPFTLP